MGASGRAPHWEQLNKNHGDWSLHAKPAWDFPEVSGDVNQLSLRVNFLQRPPPNNRQPFFFVPPHHPRRHT